MRDAYVFTTVVDQNTGKYHVMIEMPNYIAVSSPFDTLAEAEAMRDQEANDFFKAMEEEGRDPQQMTTRVNAPSKFNAGNN